MANTYLTRTPSSAGTQTKFTFSFWVKITSASNGADKAIFSSGLNSSNYYMIRFTSGDQLQILSKDNGNNQINYNTNQVFRDTNSWYHIVLAHDTTQSSGSRIKYYVNGEQVSSFQSSVEPSASANILYVNDTTVHAWGRRNYNSDLYTDMVLSHVHFCDGYAYQASDFGSTDSTTGEWKINTSPSVSYGTNGYFILKDGNSLTDQSPNSNNWSLGGGTLTKTEDCPSNVFATFNALIPYNGTFSNGMTTYQAPSSNPVFGSLSTLGMSSGKFYAECKYSAGSNHYLILGIADNNFDACASTPDDLGKSGTTESIGYVVNTGAYRINNNNTSWGSAGGDGDILQIAVDKDNNRIYFGVNGTWGNSSNPANNTGGIDVSSVLTGDTWFFGVSNDTGASETIAQFNFGNGYFGTTAISSEGTNASGIGKFEFDVPNGFTALSTKGLNE